MFLDSLKDDVSKLKKIIDAPLAMNLTEDDKYLMKLQPLAIYAKMKFKKMIKSWQTIVI